MVVKLEEDLFRQENLQNLRGLIWLATYKGRYDLVADIAAIGPDLDRLDGADQEVLTERFERWMQEGNPEAHVVVSSSEQPDHFTLEEAITYLNQPLKILLENSDNDANFLNALLKHFKKKGKKISRFKGNQFLEYANAGGKTNVEHYIRGELRKYGSLPKESQRYLRLFVLVDSDSEHKGEEKPAITALKTYLESLGVPYHILTKREMENYLPDEVIQSVEGSPDFIQAYLRLQPEQKDYFDLEKGFPDQNRSQVEQAKGEAFRMLYESVSGADWQVFRRQNFGLSDFKNALPRLFEAEQVTQETLQARVAHQDNPDELKDILDAITRCL